MNRVAGQSQQRHALDDAHLPLRHITTDLTPQTPRFTLYTLNPVCGSSQMFGIAQVSASIAQPPTAAWFSFREREGEIFKS